MTASYNHWTLRYSARAGYSMSEISYSGSLPAFTLSGTWQEGHQVHPRCPLESTGLQPSITFHIRASSGYPSHGGYSFREITGPIGRRTPRPGFSVPTYAALKASPSAFNLRLRAWRSSPRTHRSVSLELPRFRGRLRP